MDSELVEELFDLGIDGVDLVDGVFRHQVHYIKIMNEPYFRLRTPTSGTQNHGKKRQFLLQNGYF